jgi:6-phosphogluconolactonase/glucosamine-6-phosphate isomerase/deaminase
MKLIKVRDNQELSQLTGNLLIGLMLNSQTRYNLSITAGRTPKNTYDYMIPIVKNNSTFDNVHYYNFDEVPSTDPNFIGITMRDLKELYFDPAGVDPERIHHLNPSNYKEQDARILADGGLDAVLMGIGEDGHFCGNLPGTTKFEDLTVKVPVTDRYKESMASHYDDPALTPDFWITMGPRSIMNAKKLIMIADGKAKAEAIWNLVEGPVSEEFPSSILKLHPDLTVIVDEQAASKLK